jgi:ABC-type uncharacterized transport system involved in gliding motility auxiliary subunit
MATQGGVEKMRNAKWEGKMPLALRLQGTFKTAFPNGRPASGDEEEEGAPAETSEPLTESTQNGVVVLVSDVDMINDRFCLNRMNFMGRAIFSPSNDNLAFTLNMIEQLTGSEALIGLRSRGTFNRPFDRVLQLEKDAQKQWQEEELKLVQKLQDTQQRINELQQSKDKDQQFILSPEQAAEVEKFRKQRFETQRQLKEVRKNLRRKIEQLGLTVKIANIAFEPMIVAVFGVAHGVWRKRKALR